jgi:hypothetical protein
MRGAATPPANVPFEPGSFTLSSQGQAAVQGAVATLQGDAGLDAMLVGRSATVHAQGTDAAQGAIESMDMARARAEMVRATLTSSGTDNARLNVRNEGERGATADPAWNCVTVAYSQASTRLTPALHEGGHMLGNSDEYAEQGPQPTYDAMVQSATGQTINHDDDADIMSVGNNIQPWNYSAFVMAIRQMTGMQDWQI